MRTLAVGVLMLASSAALLGWAPSARAGSGSATAATSPMERLVLAEELTTRGLASQDPLVLLMAARLKQLTPDREVQRPVLGAATQARPRNAPAPRSAEALLARVRTLAAQRPDLLALAEDIAKERPRGLEGGPRTHRQVAAAAGTDTYIDNFRPGDSATVLITGDGESNLDLYVFDSGGRRICASEKLDDVEVCRWQPASPGRYRVQVVNRGRVENQYEMRSN